MYLPGEVDKSEAAISESKLDRNFFLKKSVIVSGDSEVSNVRI